jgi:hypothetical protein
MKALLEQALAALKTCDIDYDYDEEPYGVYDDQLVFDAIEALEQELAKPEKERNFCERCGKRVTEGWIHTCTPPEAKLRSKNENS